MATLKTITGLATNPGGSNLGKVSIQATLSQACTIPGTQEVVPETVFTRSAADGTYTLQLYSNNDLTPNGTYYTVVYEINGRVANTLTIQVPTSAGPFVISNLLVSTPTASPSPNHVSTLTVDNLTAGQVVYADTAGLVATDSTFGFNKTTKLLTATAATLTGALTAASASLSGALSAASGAFTGAVTAASGTITGLWTAGTLTATGAVNGASAAITGAITAASAVISGTLTAAGGLVVTTGGLQVTAGNVGLGVGPSGNNGIQLGGLPLTGNTQTGVFLNHVITSAATVGAYGFVSNPSTQAAAFTTGLVAHFNAADVAKGAGSVVTTQYGILINSMLSGVTNYAIYTNTGPVSLGDSLTVRAGGLTVTAGGLQVTAGNAGIGGAIDGNVGVKVSLIVSGAGGLNQYAFWNSATYQSGATSAGAGFVSQPSTAASAFTMSSLFHFQVADAAKGAGSAITTQYGLYVANLAAGTTNYAIYTNTGPVSLGDSLTVRAGGLTVSAGTAAFGGALNPATPALAVQSALSIYAGTGAPNNANGNNGDIYNRSDGGALTTIYQKRAGAWTGIV